MSIGFELSHVVYHPKRDVTEKEAEEFLDKFIDLVKGFGFLAGGGMRMIDVSQ